MNPADTLNLPPLPPRIAKLPKNARGYPVPYFVAWIDGKPDFRFVEPGRIREAMRKKVCWICGEPLNAQSTFVIGPMCAINRTNSEPPSHRQCAEFAVCACPFMLRPSMVRREDDQTRAHEDNTAGLPIKRNPGVMALWTTNKWTHFRDHNDGILFNIGKPNHVSWWREGRAAKRAEVMDSIATGLPALLEVCDGVADRVELYKRENELQALLRETCDV